ncbi:MAG: hypothetical protein WBA74_10410 [Cyclobacteriaceae bacterium]
MPEDEEKELEQEIDLGIDYQEDDTNDDEKEIVEDDSNNANDDSEQVENEDDQDLIVTIGDEEPEEVEKTPAPKWVNELRKKARKLEKENKELKRGQPTEKKPVKLESRPTFESCDYDEDVFNDKLDKWKEDKRNYELQEAEKEEAKKTANKQWQDKLNNYEEKKRSLKVKDFEEVEEDVVDVLSVEQQGLIVSGSDNPALVVYALGKNKKKLEELAKIKDPIKYVVAIVKLEAQLKVKNGKGSMIPESRVKTSGGTSLNGNSKDVLERLRAEAAKTGDFTKLHAYKRKNRS